MARFALLAVAIAASLVLSNCAVPRRTPENERPPAQIPATIAPEQAVVPTPAPPAPAPALAPAAPASAPAPAPVSAPAPAPASAPTPPTRTPSATKASPGATSGRPVSKPSDTAATAASKPSAEPAPKSAVPESPTAPTLDLGSLEQRLKDTRAIGVFTKLSLKNQVDDLLAELRAFHSGSAKTPTAELRQKYDTLIIKVLTLLQNGDPQLASAIASSREALWGVLMDPKKFSQI
jgi:hypothetical protein